MNVPFSNASEFEVWQYNNCDRCRHHKYCAILNALALAAGTGDISQRIVTRAGGFYDDNHDEVPCKEKNALKNTAKRRAKNQTFTESLFPIVTSE